MGYRAHACKKRIVEYDDGNFNYQKEELCKFLQENIEYSYLGEDFWQLNLSEMENLVRLMKINISPEKTIIAFYTAKEVIDIFQGWIDMVKNNPENYSDPEWIAIEWY